MDFEDIRHALALLHQSHDSLIYAQFTDWLQAMYEVAKEQVLSASPQEREQAVGKAKAYQQMLRDLSQPIH